MGVVIRRLHLNRKSVGKQAFLVHTCISDLPPISKPRRGPRRTCASMLSTKQANLRKTVQRASQEARRWQVRTNKSMKDVQGRAKRSMREMMSIWKRNEREERDLRRMAEKQEIENAKRAEAAREANRQGRKLNFIAMTHLSGTLALAGNQREPGNAPSPGSAKLPRRPAT